MVYDCQVPPYDIRPIFRTKTIGEASLDDCGGACAQMRNFYSGRYKLAKDDYMLARAFARKYKGWLKKPEKYKRQIAVIEHCAEIASSELKDWILKAISEELAFEDLKRAGMPAERTAYYGYRRKFYYLLSKELDK